MKKNSLTVFVALALSTTCKILAAAPPEQIAMTPTERDFFTELPVVLSVSRLAQPVREAPGAVTVIDAEMIRQSGARTVAELLRLVPGFQVAESPQGDPLAVYHGLTTDQSGRMQVLVDGRTQYSPLWFGGVNWSLIQVSLQDIERIEVVRGSNSATYGANAVLGVVNIMTYSPDQTHGTKLYAAAGNRGTQSLFARHGWGSESGNHRISIEESRTDGLDGFPDSRIQHRLSGRSAVRLDRTNEFDFHYGVASVKQESGYYPEPTTWLLDEPPATRYIQSYYGQAAWAKQLDGGDELKVRYFRVFESGELKYLVQLDDLPPTFVTDFYGVLHYQPSITRDDIEVQHILNLGVNRLVWGVGGRNDRVDFAQIHGTEVPISNQLWRAFGNFEWRVNEGFLVNLGGTYEIDSISGATMAPRLMFTWMPTKTQAFRAGVSRAYRTPSLYEQRADERLIDQSGLLFGLTGSNSYQETLSTRLLDPEELTAFEVGHFSEWGGAGVVTDVRAFREELRKRVVRHDVPGQTYSSFSNAQNVNIQGVEGQIRFSPNPSTKWMINHSVTQITATTYNPVLSAGDQLSWNAWAVRSAPANQTSVHWVQKAFGLESSLAYYRMPSYKWTRFTNFPAYERIDWRLGYPFKLDGRSAELALTVRSIGSGHAEYRRGTTVDRYNKQIVEPVAFVSFRVSF